MRPQCCHTICRILPIILLCILVIMSIISYQNAYDYQVWWTEFTTAGLIMLVGGLTYHKFRFSNISYCILFVWCVIQLIGAHYTFELVPFDWFNAAFEGTRNHYDRVAHFVVGCFSFVVSEFVWRKQWVSTRGIATLAGIISIMAMANTWELIEWIYAEIDGGAAGLAFLGSQGDVWDAQKDMLMDTCGAILSGILFYCWSKGKNIR